MEVRPYLEKKQPLVHRTFSNALKSGKVSHAYLLVGEAGVPIREIAIYLAKSLLCDHGDPLADENCITCQRIEKGEYPDFILLDGEEGTVKKDSVSAVSSLFSQTALEEKGIMVYVINEAEKMTPDAANSLLKFLEEPNEGTYAILTSRNEAKLLPTIVSRCEKVRLVLSPRSEVIQEAIELGTEPIDAEVLSYFYNDGSLVQEEASSEDYQIVKKAMLPFLEALAEGPAYARYIMQKDVTPALFSRQSLRFFLDYLSLVFQDIATYQRGSTISLQSYGKIVADLAGKLPHVDSSLLCIMTLRGEAETNINAGLLLSHLVSVITKE